MQKEKRTLPKIAVATLAAAVISLLAFGGISFKAGYRQVPSGTVTLESVAGGINDEIEVSRSVVNISDEEFLSEALNNDTLNDALDSTTEVLGNQANDGQVGMMGIRDDEGNLIEKVPVQQQVNLSRFEEIKQQYEGVSQDALVATPYSILVKYSLVDAQMVYDGLTIDALWADDNLEYATQTALGQLQSVVKLYAIDNNSTYFIGVTDNGMRNGGSQPAIDWMFAQLNNDGQVINDCYYDPETGLVLVPRSVFENENGIQTLRIQQQ